MDYRKEIDGLRALAILPVVLFHTGLPQFNWGYIGVDIFFVISGFLITTIIFPKIESNDFTFLWFYENRIRRLFPALFLMVSISTLIALFLLDPIELKEFSYSIFSSIFFYSNFFFWKEIDYFESSSELMPFLHTWSLSIEEQFYIFFPFVLILVVKTANRHILRIMLFFAILSLTLWMYGNIFFQTATFYLPVTRAWELLAGAFLAIYIHKYGFLKYRILSTLGLLILFLSFYFFSAENKLKNLLMVLPVIGTLMILSVKSHYSFVNAILMNKISIFFGLISYSLYLFHQPIFAFAKIYYIDLEQYKIIFLIILSILLSTISWKYFEQIFRVRYKSQLNFSKTLLALSLPFLLSISLAIYAFQTDGNRSNYIANLNYEELRTLDLLERIKQENEKDIFIDNGKCIFSTNNFSAEIKERILECGRTFGEGVLFFGDSHSKDIFNSYQYLNKGNFIVGISENFCQGHITFDHCYYPELIDFLEKQPQAFNKIYFHQAGYFFLSQDGQKLNNKHSLENLSLKDESASFKILENRVDQLIDNLKYFPESIILIGPRIEPHIQNKYIKKYSCAHEFQARQNLELAFISLDKYFEDSLSTKNYISLQKIVDFSMEDDFINCNAIFWSDGDHWSDQGEKLFSLRLSEL